MASERTQRERRQGRRVETKEDSPVGESCVDALYTANSGTMKHLSTYLVVVALAPAVLAAQSSADLVLTNGDDGRAGADPVG